MSVLFGLLVAMSTAVMLGHIAQPPPLFRRLRATLKGRR